MTCGIYQILNTITGKCYVGKSVDILGRKGRWVKHKGELEGNAHHSSKLQRSWNKYGVDVWQWNILRECEREKLVWLEAFYIAQLNSVLNGYNIQNVTLDNDHYLMSEEHRSILSKAHRGKFQSEETRAKRSESNRGKIRSSEARANMSKAQLGKKASSETRKKQSTAKLGKPGRLCTEEEKIKIGNAHRGKIISDDHKARLREANSGNIPSLETREKLSISGKKAWAKRKAS